MAVKDEAAEIDRLLLENEQLLEARRLAEERSYRYADLFEHAPLPYVTLDGAGAIQGPIWVKWPPSTTADRFIRRAVDAAAMPR